MSAPAPLYYTRDLLRELHEGGVRYELVRGELLVTPAPGVWHEIISRRIDGALSAYCRGEKLPLHVFGNRSEISWGEVNISIEPDVLVVPLEQARTLDWDRLQDLQLVVEVLSASTARHDRFTKRLEYQQRGVPLYWIVDPDELVVEVWTPGDRFPTFKRERVTWQPEGAEFPFALELAELFRPI